MIVDDDTGTRLESWDQTSEDLDGVRSRVVVYDPAKVVDWQMLDATFNRARIDQPSASLTGCSVKKS